MEACTDLISDREPDVSVSAILVVRLAEPLDVRIDLTEAAPPDARQDGQVVVGCSLRCPIQRRAVEAFEANRRKALVPRDGRELIPLWRRVRNPACSWGHAAYIVLAATDVVPAVSDAVGCDNPSKLT